MSDMVEKVARAIRERELGKGCPVWEEDYAVARAAIEAMREPDKVMLRAAAKSMSPEKRPTAKWVSCQKKHEIRFTAMIDAALKGEAE